MTLNSFINLVGETTTTGLHLFTLLRRDEINLPVYGARCIRCGTSGIPVPHRHVQQESAHCPNPRCGTEGPESRGTARAQVMSSYQTGNARSQLERREHAQRERTAQQRRPAKPVFDPSALTIPGPVPW